MMILATPVRRSCSVEIAQTDGGHASSAVVGEQTLEVTLCFPVGIHRSLGRILRDWYDGWMTVHRTRRRENETTHLGSQRRIQEHARGGDVIGLILLGLRDR